MSTDFEGKKLSQILGSVHIRVPAVDAQIAQNPPWSSGWFYCFQNTNTLLSYQLKIDH
jgi:hypothetical protein